MVIVVFEYCVELYALCPKKSFSHYRRPPFGLSPWPRRRGDSSRSEAARSIHGPEEKAALISLFLGIDTGQAVQCRGRRAATSSLKSEAQRQAAADSVLQHRGLHYAARLDTVSIAESCCPTLRTWTRKQ
ncbi:hypothetical protein Cadr_000009866, partial [Camelus dromedarius]